jgi:hypothetical protein
MTQQAADAAKSPELGSKLPPLPQPIRAADNGAPTLTAPPPNKAI